MTELFFYKIKTVGGFHVPAASAFISFSDTAVFASGPENGCVRQAVWKCLSNQGAILLASYFPNASMHKSVWTAMSYSASKNSSRRQSKIHSQKSSLRQIIIARIVTSQTTSRVYRSFKPVIHLPLSCMSFILNKPSFLLKQLNPILWFNCVP